MEEVRFSRIQALRDSRAFSTVEELFRDVLPPELLARSMLLPHSRSSQPSSPIAPRILLYNEDASVVIGVSGGLRNLRRATVEFMEYDARTNLYQFRALSFGGAPIANCAQCHQGRPIWDGKAWPEAFGQAWFLQPGISSAERAYESLGAWRAPYRYLPYSASTESNTRFTAKLRDLEAGRLAHLLAQLPQEPRYRAALQAAWADEALERVIQALSPADPARARARYAEIARDTELEVSIATRALLDRARRRQMRGLDFLERELGVNEKPQLVAKLRLVLEAMGAGHLLDRQSTLLAPPSDPGCGEILSLELGAGHEIGKRGFLFGYGPLGNVLSEAGAVYRKLVETK